MQDFAAMYAERGYTTLEIDLAPPPPGDSAAKTSGSLIEYFTKGTHWPCSRREY
jgi:hypothetical protein